MDMMKAGAAALLARIPGKRTEQWPMGEAFARAFAYGDMSVELYAPRGTDPQQPHRQDELYFIHAGTGVFRMDGQRHSFEPGACFLVPAGVEHRFETFSPDFATWVVFWGPDGGSVQAIQAD